jgi:hypothetical protein
VAQTDVFAEAGGQEKLIALLTATLMVIQNRHGIKRLGGAASTN